MTGGISSRGGVSNDAPNLLAANQLTVYAAGTVYTLTNAAALIHLGTTDPTITLTLDGTYKIDYQARFENVGATFAASRLLTLKLRKTSGSAADVANSTVLFNTPIITALTSSLTVLRGSVIYTGVSGDILSLYTLLDTVPSAGSVTVPEAQIVAYRLQQ